MGVATYLRQSRRRFMAVAHLYYIHHKPSSVHLNNHGQIKPEAQDSAGPTAKLKALKRDFANHWVMSWWLCSSFFSVNG